MKLELTKFESIPCSGGWPILVCKEWKTPVEGIIIKLSYYSGGDVRPMTDLYMHDRRPGYMDTPLSESQHVWGFEDGAPAPDDQTVEWYVQLLMSKLGLI